MENKVYLFALLCLISSNLFAVEAYPPTGIVYGSIATSEGTDNSKILGLELQYNKYLQESLAVGFHGMIQNQQYKQLDTERYGLGLSLNYYFTFESTKPFIGIKKIWYGILFEDKQEALDCLYCSDIKEDYSGGESYLSFGFSSGQWIFQIDKRISDNRSDWSESAYDPYGVGQSYYKSLNGIPDPEILFQIGYIFK